MLKNFTCLHFLQCEASLTLQFRDASGASTSVISNHSHPVLRCPGQQRQQLQALRKENSLLLDQLLEMQHNYQALLKHNLAEQRLHLQTLSQSMQQQRSNTWTCSVRHERRGKCTSHLSRPLSGSAPRPGPGGPSGRVPSSGAPGAGRPDAEMLDWLIKLNLNQDAIQKVADLFVGTICWFFIFYFDSVCVGGADPGGRLQPDDQGGPPAPRPQGRAGAQGLEGNPGPQDSSETKSELRQMCQISCLSRPFY